VNCPPVSMMLVLIDQIRALEELKSAAAAT
jgi:hypothetical protein